MSDRQVAIVGAALSDIGRVDDKTSYELHWQATSRALADAGLGKQDVGGFMSQGTGMLPPVELTEYMGIRPTWVDSTGVGGATWEFMVEHAYAAIAQRLTDVVVLVTERAVEGPPDLVVEILSPSSNRKDRTTKAGLYARFGIAWYWIADPIERTIEIYELEGDRYRLVSVTAADAIVTSPLFPGLEIRLADVWT